MCGGLVEPRVGLVERWLWSLFYFAHAVDAHI